MKTNRTHSTVVPVRLPGNRSYDIRIGAGLLAALGQTVRSVSGKAQALLVTDKTVAAHCLAPALASLKRAGIQAHPAVLPPGERTKNLSQYKNLLHQLTTFDDARDVVVVALGGGVVGDLAGFVAATYKRGVPFIQAPTTLLACVDSSVGGKTGVDLPCGKNLVGAFHQPFAVLMDLDLLRTLPPRELRAGYAEVVKTALIFDHKFFQYLERNLKKTLALDAGVMAEIVARCCRHKARVVARDERDRLGVRALLNFGHTFGHAAEAALGYRRLRHGEAVAVGMLCAADLSVTRGMLDPAAVSRIQAHLSAAGLPTHFRGCQPGDIFNYIKFDKKFARGKTRLILLQALGSATLVEDISLDDIRDIIKNRTIPSFSRK